MTIGAVLAGEARWHVEHGDCLAVLRAMPDASVDAVVTDPPYELGFMGRAWDRTGIANSVDLWREALRVLRPGGHLLAFGGTRTAHRMVCAIEDAGFEVRDSIVWLYGSGFPKSHNVGAAIDREAGAVRETVGTRASYRPSANAARDPSGFQDRSDGRVTAPATDAARQWDGWGTALKPAHEPIAVARRPLVGTVAANVLAHGTGAINVDACRVGAGERVQASAGALGGYGGMRDGAYEPGTGREYQAAGRWPSNVVLSHIAPDEHGHGGCREAGTRNAKRNVRLVDTNAGTPSGYSGGLDERRSTGSVDETVPAYDCAPGCAVAALDEQSGVLHTHGGTVRGDMAAMGYGGGNGSARVVEASTGGASRFFYCAKASRAEREAGLPGRSSHPTVKPLTLMRWLVRLVTPPGGIVLDPFNGSGSTGCACVAEGLRYVGIEREAEYVEIARARIAHWQAEAAKPAPKLKAKRPRAVPPPPASEPRDTRQAYLFEARTA